MLFVGPHRTWRSGSITDIVARGFNYDYSDILKQDNIPGFQYVPPGGLHWLGGLNRIGSNADDAQALVKTAIVRIENRAQQFIAEEYRRQNKRIAPESVPDLLQPLADMVEVLLPHLRFVGVDASEATNIRVVFEPKVPVGPVQPFDIDDLSSGEKAAIALFMPFIERSVKTLIGRNSSETDSALTGVVSLTMMIDEPEIHLHPLLQLNVLEYMRGLARDQEAQFIFTTHSPTLLDALDTDELYLLSPAALSPLNQLSKLTDSLEPLEVARSITGSTHLLTRGKPIVFIEGEPDLGPSATDQRLIKQLLPVTQHWATVPSHGRSQVVSAVKGMRAARLHLPGMPVFGLVDGDTNADTGEDSVITWPVAMIENLLLDEAAICNVARPYTTLGLTRQEQVRRSLEEIAKARRDDEILLRVQRSLPTRTLRPAPKYGEDLQVQVQGQTDEFLTELQSIDIEKIRVEAETEVDAIIKDERYLERFHGKLILKAFYDQHCFAKIGLGWNAFLTEVARHASESERVKRLAGQALNQIKLYFPPNVSELLDKAPPGEICNSLKTLCINQRRQWEQRAPDAAGREALRQRLVQFARELSETDSDLKHSLLDAASSIGTSS